MDKILAVILVFIAMMIIMAAVLAMGAVPKIYQGVEISNQTLVQQHEDDARKNQSDMILNQTKTIILTHHNELQDYVDRQNNTTRKLLQNQENMIHGIETLLNSTVQNIAENQIIIQKYGTENNALGRALVKELGLNVTTILDEYYTKYNMTPIYPPPPKLNTTN